MAQIGPESFDQIMESLSGGERDAPGGMDGELHRLMPLLTDAQRSQLLAWALYVAQTSHTEGAVSQADQEGAKMLTAFTVGVEVGQRVGQLEGAK